MSFIYRYRNTSLNPTPTTRQTSVREQDANVNVKPGLDQGTRLSVGHSISTLIRANRIVNQLKTDDIQNQPWLIAELGASAIDGFLIPNILRSQSNKIESQLLGAFKTHTTDLLVDLRKKQQLEKIVPIATTIAVETFIAYSSKKREINNINRQTEYKAIFQGGRVNKR